MRVSFHCQHQTVVGMDGLPPLTFSNRSGMITPNFLVVLGKPPLLNGDGLPPYFDDDLGGGNQRNHAGYMVGLAL